MGARVGRAGLGVEWLQGPGQAAMWPGEAPLSGVIVTWRGMGIPLFPPFLPFGGVWGHPFWFRLNPRLQGLGKVR